jgi:predicted metal-dependent phosphoesterase TrpH
MTSRIDLHLHTNRYSPDSVISPEHLLADAARAGLTTVVITEHDAQWEPDELAELNARPEARAAGLTVLAGVEVSAREGHFLCFGLPNLANVEPGIFLKDLIREVQGHDGAIVAAHPYRWDQDFDAIIAEVGPVFQALELASKNVERDCRRRVESLLGRYARLASTGSSDAHEPGQIGCYFTEIDTTIDSMSDLVAALRGGGTRARHHPRLARWQPSGPIGEPVGAVRTAGNGRRA